MAYSKQTWVNEVPSATSNKFNIVPDSGTPINSATITPVSAPTTPGSALDATRMNYIETGIESVAAVADNAHSDAAAAQATADAAIPKSLTSTTGDIIYASSANTPARRAIGSTGDVLTVSGGVPTWATPDWGIVQIVTNNTVSVPSQSSIYSTNAGFTWSTVVDTLSVFTPSGSGSFVIPSALNGKVVWIRMSAVVDVAYQSYFSGYLRSGSSQYTFSHDYVHAPFVSSAGVLRCEILKVMTTGETITGVIFNACTSSARDCNNIQLTLLCPLAR